jgi:pyroglutamyl-peptidase
LCEFIYYASLAHFWEKGGKNGEGERPVLFLHVPQDDGDPEAAKLGQMVTMNLIRAVVSNGR